MNPRYLAYCRAHGMTPDEMLAYDIERFPGGKMAGFIVWVGEQRVAFAEKHGARSRYGPVSLEDVRLHLTRERGCYVDIHAEFDAWLSNG